jgi:hypothetical protein
MSGMIANFENRRKIQQPDLPRRELDSVFGSVTRK